jgi:hypothetical protein
MYRPGRSYDLILLRHGMRRRSITVARSTAVIGEIVTCVALIVEMRAYWITVDRNS